jgi:hypothetical protein
MEQIRRKTMVKSDGEGKPPRKTITLPELDMRVLRIVIHGELVMFQRPSELTLSGIAESQSGLPEARGRRNKPPRDPEAEYQAVMYRTDAGEVGGPAGQILAGIYEVAPDAGVPRTKVKRGLSISIPVIPVIGDGPHMDMRGVRRQGKIQVAYRPLWKDWEAEVPLEYDAKIFPEPHGVAVITNLLRRAGRSYGWGEGRPGSPDSMGMPGFGVYHVKGVGMEGRN